jgi:hypothetical protein
MAEKKVRLTKNGAKPPKVRLSKKGQDTILWTSEEAAFEIQSFSYLGPPNKQGSARRRRANPFYPSWPRGAGKDGLVNSGPPTDNADIGRYKYSFEVGGTHVDPDIDIVP